MLGNINDRIPKGCYKTTSSGDNFFVTCNEVPIKHISEFLSTVPYMMKLDMRNCYIPKLPEGFFKKKRFCELQINNCQLKELSSLDLIGLEYVLEVLNLHNNLFSSIPILGFNSIKKLILSKNVIENISKISLQNFPNLTTLILDFNKIKAIDVAVFENLPNLIQLSLKGNKLLTKEISENFFASLPNLQSLNVSDTGIKSFKFPEKLRLELLYASNNEISELTQDMFKNQPNLRKLFLNGNNISEINSHALEGLSNMNVISLDNNQIDIHTHQDLLQFCINLRVVSLSRNVTIQLNTVIFSKLPFLSDLNLSHNAIEFIDENCFPYAYSDFRFLNLSHNSLSSLDRNYLKNLSTLIYLDLSYNCIIRIDYQNLKALKNLQFLILKSNQMLNLSTNTFSDLTKLEILDMSSNLLVSVSEHSINNLKNLTYLYLNSNQFSSIPFAFFNGCLHLSQICLNNNNLNEIPVALASIPNLKILDISSNPLSPLGKNSFCHVKSLYGLYISNCGLTSLPDDVFDKLIHLKVLDASINHIESISETVFQPFISSILYIDLQENCLKRDEASEWLFQFLRKLAFINAPEPDLVVLNDDIHLNEITEFTRDYVIKYSNQHSKEFIQFVVKKPGNYLD